MKTSAEQSNHPAWPALPFEQFKPTAYLLHRLIQAIGKLKLTTPFEPHWGNLPLWLTCRGLTTGTLPKEKGTYSIDMDFIDHVVICSTSEGLSQRFKIKNSSVSDLVNQLFTHLHELGLDITINPMPQEVPNPIPFDQDTKEHPYNSELVHNWWRILSSTNNILQQFHAKFRGITPPVGLMWGTLDIRDARYKGTIIPAKPGSNIIDRNAWDDEQVEVGWWAGSEDYPAPAFFCLAFPSPESLKDAQVKPSDAIWNEELGIFLLDYDLFRSKQNPDSDLLHFFESTYQAAADKLGWDPKLVGTGKPI